MDDPLAGYEVVSTQARMTVEYLMKIRDNLIGDYQVNDIESPAVIALIEAVIRVWRDCFPNEYEGRLLQQRNDWIVERTVQEANKVDGGYITVSFPPRIYMMLKKLLPDVKWTDRKTQQILVNNFPILKGTKYSI